MINKENCLLARVSLLLRRKIFTYMATVMCALNLVYENKIFHTFSKLAKESARVITCVYQRAIIFTTLSK